MNDLIKIKGSSAQCERQKPAANPATKKPIIIEFEDYYKYSKEKKYDDLIAYMKKFPNLEACVFETFYIRLKPMVDFSADLARILY